MNRNAYTTPTITTYGTVADLTRDQGIIGEPIEGCTNYRIDEFSNGPAPGNFGVLNCLSRDLIINGTTAPPIFIYQS